MVLVWEHLTAVFQGNIRTLFVNGIKTESAVDASSSSLANGKITYDSSNPLLIGKWYPSSDTLHAEIDELRIYNRPLNGAEIQQLATTTISQGLVAHY